MICRMWRGWTQKQNADAYDSYLREELFPRLNRELKDCGYRGFHVLRLPREDEVEFVTLVWFDSRDAVRSFAGENYESPVISAKAESLLSRYSDHCDHYDLTGFDWPA
jgi:heme-degrading monooxygenase HmoA